MRLVVDLWEKYFSHKGRLSRGGFWFRFLLFMLTMFVGGILFVGLLILTIWAFDVQIATITAKPSADGSGATLLEYFLFPIVITIWLMMVCAMSSWTVRRLHDRNKSAWWLLPFIGFFFLVAFSMPVLHGSALLLPMLIGAAFFQLWGGIEIFLLPGTVGSNRFGPDPLAERDAARILAGRHVREAGADFTLPR